ncbi:hypothetical protein [Chitinophaga vietnamensis]|uniref:hypothetical protein n=1 Tax=Chitinophaga vietnamensis TaxID=2593957 RepID=UPI0011A89C26|nr:hypothetical protein [Chitinophaga vietnamensis]
MPKLSIYALLITCLFTACSKHETTSDADGPPNVFTATISGDVNTRITRTGKDVSIGYVTFNKTAIANFALGADLDSAGKKYSVTAGSLSIKLVTGEQVLDGTLNTGGLTSIETNGNRRDYSGSMYFLYYDTDINRANSKVHFTLTDITDTGKYLRLTGNFHYNAAYASADLSQPCIQEMLNHPGRQPAYNPQVCGAAAIKVNASFTVYINKTGQTI